MPKLLPIAIPILLNALSIAGTPYGIGRNDFSPIGNGTVRLRTIPALVLAEPDQQPISGVSSISAGLFESVFVKSDGSIWSTGSKTSNRFGVDPAKPIIAVRILESPGDAPFAGAISADCGSNHLLILKEDGTAWARGSGSSGQLGDGANADRIHPVPVIVSIGGPPMSGVTSIAAGNSHSVFLKSDGSVWTCGANTYGQLGDGTTISRNLPVQMLESPGGQPVTGTVAIAAGAGYTVCLKSDGTVLAVGYNHKGQLGDGSTINRSSPVQVLDSPAGPPMTGVSSIQAGDSHTLLLKSDGSVWAVGSNESGQLGDGTTTNRMTPTRVLTAPGGIPFSDATAIAAGASHSLVIQNGGGTWSFGNNSTGQLGDNSITIRNVPVQVRAAPDESPLDHVLTVAGGTYHSLFLKEGGTVVAAGQNTEGQLGDGVRHHAVSPVPMLSVPGGPPMRNVIEVASGKVHALVLKADGTLWSTGDGSHGQLGNGSISQSQQHTTPEPVITGPGGTQVIDVMAIAAGTYHSAFVKTDGSIWTFGENQDGQLGDGTSTNRTYPVPVRSSAGGPQVNGVIAVSAGHLHTVYLKHDGSPWSVGSNAYGQLGNGSYSRSLVPVRMRNQTDSSYPTGFPNDVVAVAAGTHHTLFLRADGSAWSVGRSVISSSTLASRVRRTTGGTFLTGVEAIAAGSFHSAFLLQDTSLWVMGNNLSGELGIGNATLTSFATPMLSGPGGPPVTGVRTVSASVKAEPDLFANEAHTAFAKTDGTVWTTGGNTYGQLGNGGTAKSEYPVQLADTPGGTAFTGANSISAGTYNSLLLVTDENTYSTWLANEHPDLTGSQRLTTADPDHDSIPNLLEYILGSHPAVPDAGALPVVVFSKESQALEMTFTRIATSNSDSILAYEHGMDLVNWTSVRIDTNPTPPGVTLGIPDSSGRQTVSIILSSTTPSRFIRLQAKLD